MNFNLFANDMYSLSEDDINKICGIWSCGYRVIRDEKIYRMEFSWGITDYIKYSEYFDYINGKLNYHIGFGFDYEVYEIKKVDDNHFMILMKIPDDSEDEKYFIDIEFINNDKFKLLDYKYRQTIGYTEESRIFYRISGPGKDKMKYFGVCNDKNVRLRKEPNLSSKIIDVLNAGDKIYNF